jgi:hypothetical protein
MSTMVPSIADKAKICVTSVGPHSIIRMESDCGGDVDVSANSYLIHSETL